MLHACALIRRSFVTAAIASWVLLAAEAGAQVAVFSGRVTSDGRPLGGASVGIPSIGVGAVTSVDGRYNFTVDAVRTAGRSVDVVARYIGYKPTAITTGMRLGLYPI